MEGLHKVLKQAYADREEGHGLLCFHEETPVDVSSKKGWSGTYVEVLHQRGSVVLYIGQTDNAFKRNKFKQKEAQAKHATSLGLFSLSSQDTIKKYIPAELIDMIAKTDYYRGTITERLETVHNEIARMVAETIQAAAIPSITKVVCETFLMSVKSEYLHSIRAPCANTMTDLVSFLQPCGPVVEVGTWPLLKSVLYQLAESHPNGILAQRGVREPKDKFLTYHTLKKQFGSHFWYNDCFVNASPCEYELELREEVVKPILYIMKALPGDTWTLEAMEACADLLRKFVDRVRSRPEGEYKRPPHDTLAKDTRAVLESLLANKSLARQKALFTLQNDAFGYLCVHEKEWMEETFPKEMRVVLAPRQTLVGMCTKGGQRVLVHPAWFKLLEHSNLEGSHEVNMNTLNSYYILSQALQFLGWKSTEDAEGQMASMISFLMQREKRKINVASWNCLPEGLNANSQMGAFIRLSGKRGTPVQTMAYLTHEFEESAPHLLNEVFDHLKETNPHNQLNDERQKVLDENWYAHFRKLQEHAAMTDESLPERESKLYNWLSHQRSMFNRGKLSQERNLNLRMAGYDVSR